MADGSVLPSVPLHTVREGTATVGHFVEAFYSSDARIWLMRAGVDPAGPSAGDRLRRWEKMGMVQRVAKVSRACLQLVMSASFGCGPGAAYFCRVY